MTQTQTQGLTYETVRPGRLDDLVFAAASALAEYVVRVRPAFREVFNQAAPVVAPVVRALCTEKFGRVRIPGISEPETEPKRNRERNPKGRKSLKSRSRNRKQEGKDRLPSPGQVVESEVSGTERPMRFMGTVDLRHRGGSEC